MTPDIINGGFEAIGGLACWYNVYKLYKDKAIEGVSIWATAFFASWGIWNLYYYPSLHQWCSFYGGAFLVGGNAIWVGQAIYYTRRKHDKSFN